MCRVPQYLQRYWKFKYAIEVYLWVYPAESVIYNHNAKVFDVLYAYRLLISCYIFI